MEHSGGNVLHAIQKKMRSSSGERWRWGLVTYTEVSQQVRSVISVIYELNNRF